MDEVSTNQPSVKAIRENLTSHLAERMPEWDWTFDISGPAIPAVPSGTVAADKLDFECKDKFTDLCTIKFSIYLIVPDSISLNITDGAMQVRDILNAYDGVQNGIVTNITFGSAPGLRKSAGAAIIQYEMTEWFE